MQSSREYRYLCPASIRGSWTSGVDPWLSASGSSGSILYLCTSPDRQSAISSSAIHPWPVTQSSTSPSWFAQHTARYLPTLADSERITTPDASGGGVRCDADAGQFRETPRQHRSSPSHTQTRRHTTVQWGQDLSASETDCHSPFLVHRAAACQRTQARHPATALACSPNTGMQSIKQRDAVLVVGHVRASACKGSQEGRKTWVGVEANTHLSSVERMPVQMARTSVEMVATEPPWRAHSDETSAHVPGPTTKRPLVSGVQDS
eukprot:480228-Rhodomonas_salina.7